jgi:hypothetical protein
MGASDDELVKSKLTSAHMREMSKYRMKTALYCLSRAVQVLFAVYLCSRCVSNGRIDQWQLKLKDPRSADLFEVVNCLLAR